MPTAARWSRVFTSWPSDPKVIDKKLRPVGASEMFDPFQVRLPVTDVLVVKAVNHVFPQYNVGLVDVTRFTGKT